MTSSGDIDRRRVESGWTRSTRSMAVLGGVTAVAMMVHITVDVLMRLFFNLPIQGTMEIASYYYMVGIVFLPIAYIDWIREAITVDVLFGFYPTWLKAAAVILTLSAMVFAYGGITILSFKDAMAFMARREIAMGSGNVQIWPARFILTAGLAAGTLVCAWQLILFVIGRDRASWLQSEIKVEE